MQLLLNACEVTNGVKEEEGKPDAGYVGLTANTFKVRYGNHKTSFKYSAKRINSSLFNITWKALATYPDFYPSTNSCRLCLMEKYTIMHRPDLATINQRDEFFTTCQHKQSKLLDNPSLDSHFCANFELMDANALICYILDYLMGAVA